MDGRDMLCRRRTALVGEDEASRVGRGMSRMDKSRAGASGKIRQVQIWIVGIVRGWHGVTQPGESR